MNKVILMGRLTRDPEVRYSAGENATAVARYTLAVDRRFGRRDGESNADFIGCVAFGRSAEFAEKYFRQGLKVVVTEGFRQAAIPTERDRRYTPRTWWWRIRSSRRARRLPRREALCRLRPRALLHRPPARPLWVTAS